MSLLFMSALFLFMKSFMMCPQMASGCRLVKQERPALWLECWAFDPCDRSASPPRRSRGGLGIEFGHMDKILMEILDTEVRWSFLDGVHTDVPEVTCPDLTGKGTETLCLEACKTSPCMRLFIWVVGLDSSQYNCNYKYSTLLSSMSHPRELPSLTVVIRNPHICSSWVRYAGDLGNPSSEVRASCRGLSP